MSCWSAGEEKLKVHKNTLCCQCCIVFDRFPPEIVEERPKFFWIRTNRDGHDSVAIGESPLETNYS